MVHCVFILMLFTWFWGMPLIDSCASFSPELLNQYQPQSRYPVWIAAQTLNNRNVGIYSLGLFSPHSSWIIQEGYPPTFHTKTPRRLILCYPLDISGPLLGEYLLILLLEQVAAVLWWGMTLMQFQVHLGQYLIWVLRNMLLLIGVLPCTSFSVWVYESLLP